MDGGTPINKQRKHISRRLSKPFKSPFQNSPLKVSGANSPGLQAQIDAAKQACAKLDKEIAILSAEGISAESSAELDEHIKKLHEYNEIKDFTQTILGRIAELDGVTVKELHEKYNLSLNE